MKLIPIALLFGFLVLGTYANAQESAFSENNEETPNYYIEEEITASENSSVKKNSTVNNDGLEVKADDNMEDEDVLSFNFLYYIIQRYKMGDVVEQKK